MIKVVILDDHRLFIDGLINSFSNDKLIQIIGSATDGQNGLIKIKSLKPDLVILDIDFTKTKENGTVLLKQIKTFDRSIKVLVLTSYCEDSLIRTLREDGANGYLLKNAGFQELRATIIDILNGQIVYKYDSKLLCNTEKLAFSTTLSDRALEIIRLLAQGNIVKEIAQKLDIAESTVNDHLERAKRKTGARNNCELVSIAGKTKLI